MEAVIAEHVGDQGVEPEQPGEGGVENVETARVGAERRHHHTHPVAGETAALDTAAAAADAGLGMQMAGDLAGRAGRLVAEGDRADRDLVGDAAAEIGRQRRIVIAGDPDPIAPRLQGDENVTIVLRQAIMRMPIMEAVAECDHRLRIEPGDHRP